MKDILKYANENETKQCDTNTKTNQGKISLMWDKKFQLKFIIHMENMYFFPKHQ